MPLPTLIQDCAPQSVSEQILESTMRKVSLSYCAINFSVIPELRNLATLYEFMDTKPALLVQDSTVLNCGFDSPTAACAWYSPPLNNAVGFNRGRFESLLDLEKFDCTSDRSFPFGNPISLYPPKEIRR